MAGKMLKVLFLGDLLLSKASKNAIDAGAMSHWLTNIRDIEIGFANLEGPIGDFETIDDKKKCRIASAGGSHRSLSLLGLDVLSLANNHSMDYGLKGLVNTMNAMDNSGIGYVGAGLNIKDARKPVIMERADRKIGFLGYSWGFIQSECATNNKAGVAPLKKKLMLEDIKRTKEMVDLLFVSVHWSYEGEKFPLPYQRNLAHAMIDAGASVVVGHHPHVVQGIEHYGGGIIFYSLGNFIFPDICFGGWNIIQSSENRLGLAAKVGFADNRIDELELFPFYQEGPVFIPHLLSGQDRAEATEQIEILSANWNSLYDKNYSGFRSRKKIAIMTGIVVVDFFKILVWRFSNYIHSVGRFIKKVIWKFIS
jgi:poly-gamma-glutamate synthesis protein (capsule biosynthesis protein)